MPSTIDTPSSNLRADKKIPACYNPNASGVMREYWKHQQRRIEIEELDDAIGKLNRSINASCYQLLVLIREFDERAGWLKWSFTDGVSWLKWRCDLGEGTAREKLRIAHALKELPLISEAFAVGNLSYSKVRVMTRVATPHNEADLIELARRMTVRHLTEHCKQRSNTQEASTSLALKAQNSRAFRVWHDTAKGTMHFSIELPIEEGELLEKAVDKATAHLATEIATETGLTQTTDDKEPTWSGMQADALVDVMRGYLSGTLNEAMTTDSKTKAPSSSSADHHLVMIHVDENALLKKEGTSANSKDADNTTSQYPIETVRRLCCDGSIAPIIENAKGEPLDVGRRMRTITTAIRRALWSRDRGCAFPGCNHKRFVDAHHIRHWADGGETTINNLILLCSNHHKLVHEGGFEINRDQSGQLFFRQPNGKALPHCGYHRDDWVDELVDNSIDDAQPNAREFSSADSVAEEAGSYCLH